jgi:tetratricopeptide (TPR) repeat protein
LDEMVEPDEELAALWPEVAAAEGVHRAQGLLAAGQRLLELDRGEEALAAVDTAIDLLSEAEVSEPRALCEHNAAVVLLSLGRTEEALERHRHAVELHRQRFEGVAAALCEIHVADVLRLLGRTDEALAVYAGAAIVLELGDERSSAGEARAKAGELLLELERWNEAVAELTAARELLVGCVECVARCVGMLADAHAETGAIEPAIEAAAEARALWDACGEDDQVAACDLRLARLRARSEPEEALDQLWDLRVAFRAGADAVNVARCDGAAAVALEALGQDEEAARRRNDAAAVLAAAGLSEAA